MRALLGVVTALLLLACPQPAEAHAPHVVAFGDSITWGTGTEHPGRQGWAGRIGARRVAHAGSCIVTTPCGGRRAAEDTYGERVLSLQPDVVIVAYGMNDLYWSPNRKIMAGLRYVVRANERRGIRTYVATLTPLRNRPEIDWLRVDLNRRIRDHFGTRVLDFDAALRGGDGALPRRYDSGDGLHPSAAGYKVLAAVADKALRMTPS